jgi:hypothetical protein
MSHSCDNSPSCSDGNIIVNYTNSCKSTPQCENKKIWFNLPSGDLASAVHNYSHDEVHVQVTGFTILDTVIGTTALTNLYGLDYGLGLTQNMNHEINKTSFVQLDLLNLMYKIKPGSCPSFIVSGIVKNGGVALYGSSTPGVLGDMLWTSVDNPIVQTIDIPKFGNYRYINVIASGPNESSGVILNSINYCICKCESEYRHTGEKGECGHKGEKGECGHTGPRGYQGETGPQGYQGFQGETGPQGYQGFQGETGPQGYQGYQGETGPQGFQGETGPQGFQGFQGEQGLTGETGPTGANVAPTFIHVVRLTDQTLVSEDNVIFDSIAVKYGDCDISVPSADLLFWTPGYYSIYFNIHHHEPCQFAIFLNENVTLNSVVGSPTGSSQNSSSIILHITAADVLVIPTSLSPTGFAASVNFRNHTSYAPTITLDGQSGSGSASPQPVATVVIIRIA